MMIRKAYFTLLEVLIALGLSAIILTTLGYFYLEISRINAITERSLAQMYQYAFVESRLSAVIPKATAESEDGDFFFYTAPETADVMKPGTKTLIFSYDNGIDLDKPFSNTVLGQLYIDKDNRLMLATWPSPLRWKEGTNPPVKKEILLDKVNDLLFSFYIAPDMDRSKVYKPNSKVTKKQVIQPIPAGGWVPDWQFEYYQLPAIAKILVGRQDEKGEPLYIVYEFPLPNNNKAIIYRK